MSNHLNELEEFYLKNFKGDIGRESVIYQDILKEGEQQGIMKAKQKGIIQGKQEVALNLLKEGMAIEQVVKVTGLSLELLQNLQKEINNN